MTPESVERIIVGMSDKATPVKGARIPDDELAEILGLFEQGVKENRPKMELYEEIGAKFHRKPKTIQEAVLRLKPTVNLAKYIARSNAAAMMRKIIKKGNVSELMDVLSRPSVGALDPKTEGAQTAGGLFLSVDMGSLGAVRVAAIPGHSPRLLENTPKAIDGETV